MWADAIIFGSPTRFGGQTSQFRAFIDTLVELWSQGKLADNIYWASPRRRLHMVARKTTLMSLHTTLMHFGGIIVAPGYTDPAKFVDGNPYGVSHVTEPENKNPLDTATLNAVDHLAPRGQPGRSPRCEAKTRPSSPVRESTAGRRDQPVHSDFVST